MAQISAPTSTPIPDQSGHSTMLAQNAKPPKSKTDPYYSIHPLWTDLSPIPQMDLDQPSTYAGGSNPLSPETASRLASAGPALATIAYTPRYIEAMSYLRATMAKEEFSERALALTEDIINMNPAHYTVWIYRFRTLKELWGSFSTTGDDGRETVNDKAKTGFIHELKWLEKISAKNLKNYQICVICTAHRDSPFVLRKYLIEKSRHHRQSLFQLLPQKPAPTSASWVKSLLDAEPAFLQAILELDTKNYHVWSYRQWLCAHFPNHYLLDNSKEIEALNIVIQEDVMNNSAWNHRYFIVFGSKQNVQEQKRIAALNRVQPAADDGDDDADIVDLDVVDRELDYVKDKIRYAPQNGSTWNYLKGILKYADIPITEMKEFCGEFVGQGYTFDIVDDGNEAIQGVRSSQAVEMCVEIFAAQADVDDSEDAKEKVRQGLDALSQKWDPIRRRYWDWRLKGYEQRWTQ